MTTGEESETARNPDLQDLHVLVAEDRGLIAGKIAATLRRAGCVVVGPAPTLAVGLDLARQEADLGAAVLDIDLRGEAVYPLAEALQARGVPFLFLTGYGALVIPQPWQHVLRVEKPFEAPTLLGALVSVTAAGPVQPDAPAIAGSRPAPLVRSAWECIRHSRDLIMEGRIFFEKDGPGSDR